MIVVASSKYIYLGNKLLLFAHCIASSLEHGFEIKNPSFGPYSEHFIGPDQSFVPRFPKPEKHTPGSRKWRSKYYTFHYKYVQLLKKMGWNNRISAVKDIGWDDVCDINHESFVKEVKGTKKLYLQGWHYRSNELVVKYADQIKSYFSLIPEHQNNIDALFKKHVEPDELVIGVHIRQGDFKTYLDGKYYFESEQYATWMGQMQDLFPNKKVKFLICSNEKQREEVFSQYDWFTGTGNFVEDLYSLSRCDYILGVASTFALWASFYGDTPVLVLHDQEQQVELNKFEQFPFSIDG